MAREEGGTPASSEFCGYFSPKKKIASFQLKHAPLPQNDRAGLFVHTILLPLYIEAEYIPGPGWCDPTLPAAS